MNMLGSADGPKNSTLTLTSSILPLQERSRRSLRHGASLVTSSRIAKWLEKTKATSGNRVQVRWLDRTLHRRWVYLIEKKDVSHALMEAKEIIQGCQYLPVHICPFNSIGEQYRWASIGPYDVQGQIFVTKAGATETSYLPTLFSFGKIPG